MKKVIFDSIRGSRSGDSKLDDLNENVARYITGYLRKYEENVARIKSKKGHYTKAGMDDAIEKARGSIRAEYEKEIGERGGWQKDIAEAQERFDDVTTKEPIQILIEEGRQRETRAYIKECGDDIGKLAAIQAKFLDGNETVVNAVINSPFDILPMMSGEARKIGVEKMQLRTNPAAAQRLEVLQNAQDTHESMKGFFNAELGGSGEDPIKALAGTK